MIVRKTVAGWCFNRTPTDVLQNWHFFFFLFFFAVVWFVFFLKMAAASTSKSVKILLIQYQENSASQQHKTFLSDWIDVASTWVESVQRTLNLEAAVHVQVRPPWGHTCTVLVSHCGDDFLLLFSRCVLLQLPSLTRSRCLWTRAGFTKFSSF